MGGDQAPRMVVAGANLARERFPDAGFLLFGDEAKLAPLIKRFPRLVDVARVHHTVAVVTNDAKPSQALRQGRDTSMRLAIDAVRDGHAQAVVSAGNTGALMAMSKVVLKTAPGIARPAMATFFPTIRGESVMLDLGANIECDVDNLVQFAVMGEVFSRTVLGLEKPTVGLLNVGAEEQKGHDEVRGAMEVLRQNTGGMHFHGFIEGTDIAMGTVDVVVTDGFTGNVALKTAEGTAKLYSRFLREAFNSSAMARLGYLLARRALQKVRLRTDPRRYNGAVLLGLNGISVKSHGSTDALGFATAIGVAVDMAQNGFVSKVTAELAALQAQTDAAATAEAPPPRAAVS
jgi:glycerol-3-phosphate acyltransferase PlsX